jgi:hypothetical protein
MLHHLLLFSEIQRHHHLSFRLFSRPIVLVTTICYLDSFAFCWCRRSSSHLSPFGVERISSLLFFALREIWFILEERHAWHDREVILITHPSGHTYLPLDWWRMRWCFTRDCILLSQMWLWNECYKMDEDGREGGSGLQFSTLIHVKIISYPSLAYRNIQGREIWCSVPSSSS